MMLADPPNRPSPKGSLKSHLATSPCHQLPQHGSGVCPSTNVKRILSPSSDQDEIDPNIRSSIASRLSDSLKNKNGKERSKDDEWIDNGQETRRRISRQMQNVDEMDKAQEAGIRRSMLHRRHSRKAKRQASLLAGIPKPKLPFQIPIKDFPLQGSGEESEFDQEHPIWAKQPYKYLYYTYFGLSIGLYHLPVWSVTNTLPSKRGRRDWSWKKATMVNLFRHGTKLTFRTHTNLGRDLTKEVPHSKTVRCKFVWVDPLPKDMIKGEVKRAMSIQRIKATRTCGFWYGDCKLDGEIGQKAAEGEKVMYHLHGGAYWIGTAHESDVTAAVNTQALRYMDEIYQSRTYSDASTPASEHSSDNKRGATTTLDWEDSPKNKKGKLVRSFSLDYRLCVPGKPQAGSYPAALLDALAGYMYLVKTCGFDPCNIVVAGDSAGGNLAIALCRYLRDESIAPQPGKLLLMSPWADVSRSHSGPTGEPNHASTVYSNKKSDIISPSLAFRNTAVSALLGDLPARETYQNAYLSSISLQLPPQQGGKPPHWGFSSFPTRVYITSGSAEISYDQHLTLAHRLAAGTKLGKPIYSGDKLSSSFDPKQLAGRYDYPRPKDLQISLSTATTPGEEVPSEGEVREEADGRNRSQDVLNVERDGDGNLTPQSQDVRDAKSEIDSHKSQPSPKETEDMAPAQRQQEMTCQNTDGPLQAKQAYELSKTRSSQQTYDDIKAQDFTGPSAPVIPRSPPNSDNPYFSDADSESAQEKQERQENQVSDLEERKVILDEVKDAIHDYLLFNWFEPERSQTWRRIARWIDED